MTGQEIADAVNSILKEASLYKEDFSMDSINWGDLKCNEVREVSTIYPEEDKSIEIIIDEASPDAYHLCEFVYDKLSERYGIEVYVRTEW